MLNVRRDRPRRARPAIVPANGSATKEPREVRAGRDPVARVLVVALLTTAAALGWALALLSPSRAADPRSIAAPPAPSLVDGGFIQAMALHHEQAIEMARVVLGKRDVPPEIESLADTIEIDQTQEAAWMHAWLSLWDEPAQPPASAPMAWMTQNATYYCGLDHRTMPGLASPADLRRLAASSGTRLGNLFLQLMLRHHEGGLEMTLYAIRYARLANVRGLANAIVLEQTPEISLMTALLRQHHVAPLPFATSQALQKSLAGSLLNRPSSSPIGSNLSDGWG